MFHVQWVSQISFSPFIKKKRRENSVFQRRGLLKDDTSQETLYCVNIVFQPKKNYI